VIPASVRSDADDLPIVLRADEREPLAGGRSFVPMAHAYAEPHPAGRTLPGHDLEVGEDRPPPEPAIVELCDCGGCEDCRGRRRVAIERQARVAREQGGTAR
jgi:hypothetical protein